VLISSKVDTTVFNPVTGLSVQMLLQVWGSKIHRLAEICRCRSSQLLAPELVEGFQGWNSCVGIFWEVNPISIPPISISAGKIFQCVFSQLEASIGGDSVLWEESDANEACRWAH